MAGPCAHFFSPIYVMVRPHRYAKQKNYYNKKPISLDLVGGRQVPLKPAPSYTTMAYPTMAYPTLFEKVIIYQWNSVF